MVVRDFFIIFVVGTLNIITMTITHKILKNDVSSIKDNNRTISKQGKAIIVNEINAIYFYGCEEECSSDFETVKTLIN